MSKNRFWVEEPLFELSGAQNAKKQAMRGSEVPVTVVDAVWEHYVALMHTRGRRPLLTEDRVKLIRRRVAEHGADTVKSAISGCANSDWHMGGNPSGKKYNSIELILRNAEKIEWFLQLSVVEDDSGDPF